jgi:TolB-like protein/class 3 adenylate cyclase
VVEDRVDRRLAAIFAGDIAGYSRLMGSDEEGTLRQLKAHRKELVDPKITEHRGRIVKTTGDGMLVEFVSVVDAVRCAVDIQRGMAERNADVPAARRIEFRIGINVGDIISDENDIYGDGVNVAARLEALAEPGGILVSRNVHDQVRDKLAFGFEDLGEQMVKNIARPIGVHRVQIAELAALAETRSGVAPPSAEAASSRPSIAVLPFANISGDPEQEYFADGMVEEIITALSRVRWLFVIARNSTFTYKGRAVDIKQVGRELGVRYIVEGSVRKAGSRIRINAQLIDASDGTHLWADRFDGGLEDVFDLQDEVTVNVVSAIAPKLEQAEMARAIRKPTESLDAYDYYLRGMASAYRGTREGILESLALFLRAANLDPNFGAAHSMAAWCHMWCHINGWTTDRQQESAETRRLVRQAAVSGKDDAIALSFGGLALAFVTGDCEGGASLIDRALLLNPNLASAWNASGWVRAFLGENDTAIDHLARAMRLSPLDPLMFMMQHVTALAHFNAGRNNETLLWARKALRDQPNFVGTLRLAAASSALSGDMEQARSDIARVRELDPAVRVSNLADRVGPFRPNHLARYADALRLAGLPD